MLIIMQRKITISEFENVVSVNDDIEPVVIKRENKKDLERYQKEMFLNKIEKSKKQYKKGKVHDARTVFKGLREKYGY